MLSSKEIDWLKKKFDSCLTSFIRTHYGLTPFGAYLLTQEEYSRDALDGGTVRPRKFAEVVRFFKIMDCTANLKKGDGGMVVEIIFNINNVRLSAIQHKMFEQIKNRKEKMQNEHLETLRNIDKKNKNGEQDELSELVEAVRERISSYAEKSNEEIQQLILDFQKKLKK